MKEQTSFTSIRMNFSFAEWLMTPSRARSTVVAWQNWTWLFEAEVGLQDAHVGVGQVFAVVVDVHLRGSRNY